MKIYMVKGYNSVDIFEPWQWNLMAFATEEAAKKFIQNIDKFSIEGDTRIEELDNKEDEYGLTEEERNERQVLYDRWIDYTDKTHLFIEEYEVYE